MKCKQWFFIFLFSFYTTNILLAQVSNKPSPFQEEIDAYAKADKIMMPDQGSILFAGSSSFRLWHDVKDYFPGKTILNRGFGGSTLLDLIQFSKKLSFNISQNKFLFIVVRMILHQVIQLSQLMY